MVKIVGYFWLFVLLAGIAGFVWLGLTDVPVAVEQQTITIPAQDFISE